MSFSNYSTQQKYGCNKSARLKNVSQSLGLDVVHVDNVGVDVELELLALGGGLAGVLGVEDGVEFLELGGG